MVAQPLDDKAREQRAMANTARIRQAERRRLAASQRIRDARYNTPTALDPLDTARNADAYEDWVNSMTVSHGPHALDGYGHPLPSEAFVDWLQRKEQEPLNLAKRPILEALERMRAYKVRGQPVGERRYEALKMLGDGKTVKEAAGELRVSEKTIYNYVKWASVYLAQELGKEKGPA